MAAFLLSAGFAFAIYQVLAFADIPRTRSAFKADPYFRPDPYKIAVFGVEVHLDEAPLRRARRLLRLLIVIAVLFTILAIHQLVSPFDLISNQGPNIYLGFIFGPLLAIWVNNLIVHRATEELSRGQILAGIALLLLFLLGSVGNETAGLIRRYASSLKGLKIPGAELSFGEKPRKDYSSNRVAGSSVSAGTSGSNGLNYLFQLSDLIQRDRDYLHLFRRSPTKQVSRLDDADTFVKDVLRPIGCLRSWSHETGDSGLTNKHLEALADSFRRMQTLNTSALSSAEQERRLTETGTSFVRNAISMSYDVLNSSDQPAVLKACALALNAYCPTVLPQPATTAPDPAGDIPQAIMLECLRDWQRDLSSNAPRTDEQIARVKTAVQALAKDNGLNKNPYFAMGYSSIMAQLSCYPAAASIFEDWLDQQRIRKPTMGGEERAALSYGCGLLWQFTSTSGC
jgi:hypothetical protein